MAQINWEITIANTLGVEEVGTDNKCEVELDFYPQNGYTDGSFNSLDDPETGDAELDKLIVSIVKDVF